MGKARKTARTVRLGAPVNPSPQGPGAAAGCGRAGGAAPGWGGSAPRSGSAGGSHRPCPADPPAAVVEIGERRARAGLGKVGSVTCGTEPAKTETPP